MIVGIDASNIRRGGGITHLKEIIDAVARNDYKLQIIVWAPDATLEKLPDYGWMKKIRQEALNKNIFWRIFWQKFKLSKLADKSCDILFVPGGIYTGSFKPFVTMSQNMLPFDTAERNRYGFSYMFIRLVLIKLAQLKTFSRSNGIIFLTKYAESMISKYLKPGLMTQIIPHGIAHNFKYEIAASDIQGGLSKKNEINLLYVSIVDVYKHQWNVVEAVRYLRDSGLNLKLTLVGPSYPKALNRLKRAIEKFDPQNEFVNYLGEIEYTQLPKIYHNADIFVYASSCENLPIILLEAVASGKPVITSNRGPMPEVMGADCIYFNPEDPRDIAIAINKLLTEIDIQDYISKMKNIADKYDWQKSANQTIGFILSVYNNYHINRH